MLKKSSLLLSLLIAAANLYATHNRSGEIVFRKLGGLEVEATIITYTKASSVNVDRDSLVICWGDGQCIGVVRANGKGDLIGPDLKKNIYVATHRYAVEGIYRLFMTDPNRTGGILNINAPASDNVPFHIEAMLRLLPDAVASVASPIFLEPPVDGGFVNQPFVHVPNAFDQDGDSLAYELVTPMQGDSTLVPNYMFPNEVRPGPDNLLSFDPQTGRLVWDSPKVAGDYVLAIRVRSYHNGILVEEILRDLYVSIRPLFNVPPSLIVNAPEDGLIDVLVGQTVELEVRASDPNPGQQVTLSATGGLFEEFFQEKAVFYPNSGKFTWTVRSEHVQAAAHQVVFKAKDDFPQEGGAAAFKVLRFRVKAVSGAQEQTGVGIALRISPNPAASAFYLDFGTATRQATVLSLYDGQGRLQWMEQLPSGISTWRVEPNALPQGIYWLSVRGGDGKVWRGKVTKV